MIRRKIFRSFLIIGLLSVLLVGQSVFAYTRKFPNDSLQQNVASWARNNYLGAVVDKIEAWTHDEPPSVAPAESLALVTPDSEPPVEMPTSTSTSTTIPTTTSSIPVGPATPTSSSTSTTSTSSTSTSTTTSTTIDPTLPTVEPTIPTTTTTLPWKPIPVNAVISPALVGEGKWVPIQKVRGEPVIWATSLRPIPKYGSVVATAASFDPLKVRIALFNGTEMPGKGPWINKNKINEKLLPSLIATFNGGFRFEHEPGGYFTEARTIKKLVKGFATFAIREDGTSTIGVWGDDLHDDGTWTSLRQNLPPIVQQGKSSFQKYKGVHWGNDFNDKLYTFRSAACTRTDGRMMFISVGNVNIDMLAQTLILLGCDTGMELDINGTWPHFAIYSSFGTKKRLGTTIDRRMGDANRYTTGSTKDFFALFDPETVPVNVVR